MSVLETRLKEIFSTQFKKKIISSNDSTKKFPTLIIDNSLYKQIEECTKITTGIEITQTLIHMGIGTLRITLTFACTPTLRS